MTADKKTLWRRRCAAVWMCIVFPVALLAQQASFTYTAAPQSQCTPTVISFRNTSTGNPVSISWNFGDGRSSTEQQPAITYSQPGPISVTLTAYYPGGVVATATQNFTIYPASQPAFTVDKAKACGPYTATFTDQTPGAQQRVWDFGDGSTPVTTSSATVQHQFARMDTFDVTLTVTNATGCTKSLRKEQFIIVAGPEVTLATPALEGCAPYNATLQANAATINNDLVTAWNWVFGDGQSASSPGGTVQHTYAGTGTFNVSLSVTTAGGCTVLKNYPQLVRTGTAPQNVSFTATRPDNCAGTSMRLLASATGANRYRWNFGDGTTYEGPENDINHLFRQPGNVTIQMSAGSNGCYTAATPVTINGAGPVADFTFVRNCDNRFTYTFTNTSATAAGDTYEWSFDDNSTIDNRMHPTHTFAQPGTYQVRLTVRDGASSCLSTTFKTVHVFAADFNTGVATVCRSSDVPYGVVQVPHALVDHYSWRFGDGTTLNTTEVDIRKNMPVKGLFTDSLVIIYKNPAYCPDTVVKKDHLQVIAPVAFFAVEGAACEGQPVQFRDDSQPSPNIPITEWRWDFGNGTSSAAQRPPTVKYNGAGQFPVKLVIRDARHCVDSVTINAVVNPTPFVNAAAARTRLCEGASVNLQATSNAAVTWQPAYQLSCLNCNTPAATPLKDTAYIAVATNTFGCSASDTIALTVVPAVQLGTSPDTAICAGMNAQLRAWGAKTFAWTPAVDVVGANTDKPVVAPKADVTYTVSASNDPACPAATAQVRITVKPVPTVNAGPDQVVTAGSLVSLRATHSADVTQLEWKPSTWLDCPSCPQTVAAPRLSTDYAVEVINTQGCKASDVMNVKLICDMGNIFIPSAFSPNGDGENDIFYPRGKGVREIISLRIYNRLGQEVFNRSNFNIEDITQGWNGTQKGVPLGMDVYVWFLDAWCDTGERFQLKGNVTLLR
ncbi:PKD domain-containing protein [Chitinophaga lutea]